MKMFVYSERSLLPFLSRRTQKSKGKTVDGQAATR